MTFENIKHILSEDKNTWANKNFITLDIDWCHDEILIDAIEILEKYDVAATWFVTHNSPILDRLRENKKFELGIHPNFNFLLEGDHRNGRTADEIIDRLMELVPEAKSVRSHSMTQSSPLIDLFNKKGLTHECNHFIPAQSGIQLRPWRLWNSIQKVPYFWEDDLHCLFNDNVDPALLMETSGLSVFDFHPIHVYLNTKTLQLYEQTRHIHRNPTELLKERCIDSLGVREVLIRILEGSQ